ncbi:MAG: LPS assembly protein LptD [Phycisphaerales bacterium]|nr:LPS assembly protein LptD [Phycisphaerales bacterium]
MQTIQTTRRYTRTGFWCAGLLVATVAMVLAATPVHAATALSETDEYLQDDMTITGAQMHAFTDNGKPVTVVIGQFKMTVGKRVVTANNAAVWVETVSELQGVSRYNVTVYAEGDVSVSDTNKTTTTDQRMLLRMGIEGKRRYLVNSGAISSKPLTNLKFMRTARVMKETNGQLDAYRSVEIRPTSPSKGPQRISKLPARPTTTQHVSTQPTTGDGTTSKAITPRQATPVQLRASEITVQSRTKTDRVIVARGGKSNVRITQGQLASANALSLEADEMVIYTTTKPRPKKTSRAPYAPQLLNRSGEYAEGVYLTGDVIISRGERTIKAKGAYYDFVTERATILQPVFRTVQEQRNIPVYIRGTKAKMLSAKEIKFYNGVVSTSDFKNPSYSFGARVMRFKDTTPYDETGEQLGPTTGTLEYDGLWLEAYGRGIMPLGSGSSNIQRDHTALRRLSAGSMNDFGVGIESQWHLFRLLGIVEPEGVKSYLNANMYEKGAQIGIDTRYQGRKEDRSYAGTIRLDAVYDRSGSDDFGDTRKNLNASKHRGRMLARHKEYLPGDWELQGEFSWLSDRNFLEKFYPGEFWAGKEQENLIYAKKQRDNWAVTALAKVRLNKFLTQTEKLPEVSGYLIGEPLFDDRVVYYGEAHVGMVRHALDNGHWTQGFGSSLSPEKGEATFRADLRNEINIPLSVETQWGNMNVVPFATARVTHYSDMPSKGAATASYMTPAQALNYWAPRVAAKGIPATLAEARGSGDKTRLYGNVGVRMNTTLHRSYAAQSRMLDIHGLRHIITPEIVAFASTTNVDPEENYHYDDSIESHLRTNTGVSFGLYNRLQTKRGPAGSRQTVDWMRFNVIAGFFGNSDEAENGGDGMMFFSRPELSRQRSFLYGEYLWNVSDAITFMADANYDMEDSQLDTLNFGLAVRRDPRLRYYLGLRHIDKFNSTIGVFGMSYQINKKFTIRLREEYDFTYRGGVSNSTEISLIRKLPRWYVGLTLGHSARYQGSDEVTLMLTLWPEGVPELFLNAGRMNYGKSSSDN